MSPKIFTIFQRRFLEKDVGIVEYSAMATISFEIKYYFNSNGLEWAYIPESLLGSIASNCQEGIKLSFGILIGSSDTEINDVDNYSVLPKEMKEAGCDCFAKVFMSYEVDDSILEEFGIEVLDESESLSGSVDKIFGKGVFQVSPKLLIEGPEEIFID